MSVLDALLEFDPGEMRDPMGRWVHGASSPRHGSFKIGDRVKYETGSRGAGGHGPVTFTQQPGVHEVVGFQRNGYLRVREPKFGTTVDVHHTHATKITRLHPEYRGAMVQQDYARDREKIAREKAARAGKAFDPVSMLGREGTAARERGASSQTAEHADTRDKLTNLPVGQTYGLHGPRGQVGRVERTAKGFEVYGPHESEPKVHKTPSAAAGHAMRIQRSAAQSPRHADVAQRNYSSHQQVAAMNARQSQRAEAEAERQLEITARMASSSRERALAQTELERRRGARMARPRVREDAPGPLGALLEGFAAEQQDPFPGQSFAMGDQVRVSVGGGARAITGKVVRAHGGPPATHAVVAPEGGGAHVLSPVGQVKLNTPAQHAAAAKRQEREEAKQQQAQAHAQWMAAKPLGSQPPGAPKAMPAKAGPVREGLELVLEAFGPAAAGETPAQSQKIGAQNVAQAQKSLAAGWNASKHPRAQGGKFGYTTGGKRAKRGQKSGSRTLGVGAHGALVRSIQRQVGTAIDGKYGPQTRAAVSRYQQQHGLQVDGVVGRQTLASLRGSVNARRVAPGPISSRQATVKATKAKAPVKAKAKAPAKARAAKPVAPVRVAGGVLVH